MTAFTHSMTHAAAGLQGLAGVVRSSYGRGLPCAASGVALLGNRSRGTCIGGMKGLSPQ
ncbi:MAG: hypothetical protein JSR18_16095 [Proteobacteria bacterium]|nr:hypothetical protein [Pseudomonadota bacterium]